MVSVDYGLTGRISNNARPTTRDLIRRFVKDVADSDGTLLPVAVPCNPLAVHDMSVLKENVVVLPPCYTKRYLYDMYLESYTEEMFKMCLRTYLSTTDKDVPHIRVSSRTKGLLDQCFVSRFDTNCYGLQCQR